MVLLRGKCNYVRMANSCHLLPKKISPEHPMTNDLEGFPEWRDNIEARVSTLETTVETEARVRSQMDQDMSDLKIEFRAQRRLLQALAGTQSEHTATLAGHTAALAAHTATLADHTATLADHTATLADHTARLIRLEAGQAKLEAGQARLEAGMTTVLGGVQTIIGLLDREIGDEDE
jgi:chromosome segregation ATPase